MKVKVIQGTNQIGGCITEISTNLAKIIIDFGDNLDGSNQLNIKGLTSNPKQYDAVFITHSHGDHIGNVNKILPNIDVYIEEKGIEIHNIICDFKREYDKKIRKDKQPNIKELIFNQPIIIKDIKVTPFIIDHSSYNASMFLIEANNKRILHTGDFRMHGRKCALLENTLKEIGNIDLLITEGTTLSRNKELSKQEITLQKELKEIIEKYDQVYFMCSSTNIDRIVSFYKASKGSHLFIEDLCMSSITSRLPNIPNSNTFSDVYTYMSEKYRSKKEPYERYRTHTKKIIETIPFDKKFVMSIKPSMYNDLLNNKDKIKNTCLIYSMWEGYIDERRTDDKTKNLINDLKSIGVVDYYKHTSGHADRNAMEIMAKLTNPKKILIIHTDDKNNAYYEGLKIFGNKLLNKNDNEEIEL